MLRQSILSTLLVCFVLVWSVGCGSSSDLNSTQPGFSEVTLPQDSLGGGLLGGTEGGGLGAPAYTTTVNQALSVGRTGGLLIGQPITSIVTTRTATSIRGGSVSFEPGGSFTYVPPTDFIGFDSFSFQVFNGPVVSNQTANVTVLGDNAGFFVSPTGNDSTANFLDGSPFQTIPAALDAAGPGGTVTLLPGQYQGEIFLEDGQTLQGSRQTVSDSVLQGPVVLANNNTLDNLTFGSSTGDAIQAVRVTGGRISNCSFFAFSGAGAAFQAQSIEGSWSIAGNDVSNAGGDGFTIVNRGTAAFRLSFQDNTVVGSTGTGLDIACFQEASASVRLLGNNFLLNQQDQVSFTTSDNSALCADMDNNRVSGTLFLATLSQSAVLQIEQFASLGTQNLIASVDTSTSVNVVVDVAEGTCGF